MSDDRRNAIAKGEIEDAMRAFIQSGTRPRTRADFVPFLVGYFGISEELFNKLCSKGEGEQ